MPPTAAEFVSTLSAARSATERAKIEKRLAPGDEAIGVRMRTLFDASKAAKAMPLDEVEELFASPLYEARMGALCILDFRAKDRRTDSPQRRRLYETYLAHHDRITTWDMVDRAAPSVVGGHLMGRSVTPLFDLAAAPQPLRRRTAMTAPLWFVRYGDADDLHTVFAVAALLAGDPDPIVHHPVGIALGHAGARDPDAVAAFLDDHAPAMARAAVRSAVAKLDGRTRARFVR